MVHSLLHRRPNRYTQVGALVLLAPLLTVLVVGAHIVVGSALLSGGLAGWQRLTDTTTTGVLTETNRAVLRGRGATRQELCLAWFDSSDGRYVHHQVRVYTPYSTCERVQGSTATLMPGLADGLNAAISPRRPGLSPNRRLGVTFGVLDGAWVGDSRSFVTSQWSLLIIAPLMVLLPDGALVVALRERRRNRSRRQGRQPTPDSPTV